MKYFRRENYLNRLIELKDKPIIKAIVGIRRCGKSTLLMMYRDYLISAGINENDIVMMNFTHSPFSEMNADDILKEIRSSNAKYVLFDEIQMIESWDKMVITLFEELGCDIYITGSNSVMFSSKLTTLLSGRSTSIEMFPFSYKEFLEYTEQKDSNDAMTEYMTYGGFPLALMLRESKPSEIAVLEDIYNTVIMREISQKYNIRNHKMLEMISKFLVENIGNTVSVKGVKDFMNSNGIAVNFETADNYLGYLEESLAFYRVNRFNIKAKEEMVTNDKFYLSDLGLRTAVLGKREADIGHLLENLVYLELRRRGFKIFVGKTDSGEIDFVAMDDSSKAYMQVCYSLEDPETEKRELAPFKTVKDGYRRVVIVMKKSVNRDRDGIKEITIREFLTGKEI